LFGLLLFEKDVGMEEVIHPVLGYSNRRKREEGGRRRQEEEVGGMMF